MSTNRRTFLRSAVLGGTGFWVGSSTSSGQSKSPSEKLNLGVIGAGGRGGDNLLFLGSQNIVALCDVDEDRAAKAYGRYPKVKKYRDFRKMLQEQKDIDAVVVSTPDHTHAAASVMAMKLGKHVYCEKPLAHSISETRIMGAAAAQYRVATQMGNVGTCADGFRQGVEVVRAGAIGSVREVHVWTNRPSSWPQGIERPTDRPLTPSHLAWQLWLGPAPDRPYHPAYVPFKWRGWWDFGTGALGDMGCHIANLPFMALKLQYPDSVEAESSGVNSETAPKWSIIRYRFPARGDLPAVQLTWYDGGRKPPKELAKGWKKDLDKGGCLMIGDKGTLYSAGDYGVSYKLLPESDFADFKPPAVALARASGGAIGHYTEWLEACRGGRPALANFDYAAALTETILLGNVALRAGKRIKWDAVNMRATDCPEADPFIRREYRKGWEV